MANEEIIEDAVEVIDLDTPDKVFTTAELSELYRKDMQLNYDTGKRVGFDEGAVTAYKDVLEGLSNIDLNDLKAVSEVRDNIERVVTEYQERLDDFNGN